MPEQKSIRASWQEKPEVVVNEAIAQAMSKSDPSESIDALLSFIGQSMDSDRAYIFERVADGSLTNSFEWCAEGVEPQIQNLKSTPADIYEPVWMPLFRAHRPVVISDVEEYAERDPVVADILRPQGITSLVAIPLFLEGDFMGFIGIDNPSQGVDEDAAAFLETLASFTSALLRHRNNVQKLYELSSHDRVTGTYDTQYLMHLVGRARKTGVTTPHDGPDLSDMGDPTKLAVVYCNLVQFKEFNGAFGMDEGNRCLTDVGKALEQAFGTRCVSRYSADHFIVFYGRDDVWERVDEAHRLVEGLRSGFKLWLNAGVCVPSPSQKLSTAVDLAKVACDQIAKDGQSYKCLYTGKLEEELERRKYLQDHVEQAIDEGWVEVYYQPVIRSLTGRLAGVEALSRWNDPVYGNVSPGVFVPALEEKHLSWRLLTAVIENVCEMLSDRYHAGLPVVPVSVNVSRTDFESCRPFDVIQGAVRRHDIPASLVCVEITESVAMGDPEGIESVVEQFTHAGFEVWMDDFGSAYSSLNTLKDFSFGKLKLDMLFMHNFNQRSKDIISSIISMAKKLGVHTLAEGVETREQVDFLIDAGCEEIQGFYFSKPLPLHEVEEFARRIPPETRELRELYNDLGLVRLHQHETGGFVFYRDGAAHALYSNRNLRDKLKRRGMGTPAKVDDLLNDKAGRFAQMFHAVATRALKSHATEAVPFAFDGRGYRLAVRLAAQSSAGSVLAVTLQDVVSPTAAFVLDEGEPGDVVPQEGEVSCWSPMLQREASGAGGDAAVPADGAPGAAGIRAAAEGAGSAGTNEDVHGDGVNARADGADSRTSAASAVGEAGPTDLDDHEASELKRGFSVPSLDLAAASMDIRHSKADSLETFAALSSIFITLVNVDLRTWEVQPIKIARVTESYLAGSSLDYRVVARQFLERSVAESYRDALKRFVDPDAIGERLSRYGTVTIDYLGANLGWCRLFLIPISTTDKGRVNKALFAVRDINAEKAEERRMSYGISHDPLTRALNRNGLRRAIEQARGYRGTVAYVICDVDDFKGFNDTYGHERGDHLLRRVARLLIENFGASDCVARIGGDEFVVLLTRYMHGDDGADIMERIDRVNEGLAEGDGGSDNGMPGDGAATMSAGIVISRHGYRDDLYGMADKQLYEVKAAGKGGSRVAVV